MLKRMVIMLVAAGLVFGGIFGYKAGIFSPAPPPRPAMLQTVATATAQSQEWQQRLEGVGSVRAVNGASLSAEVSGTVLAIHFKSGADVPKGELLVELTSAADAARLEALKAAAALANITYDRDSGLLKRNSAAVSQATVDADYANLKAANAQVAQQQALLDYKFIRAPFSGRLGIVQVDPGQYIAPGTPTVSLQQIDPVYIDFYLPQQALAKIKPGLTVTARTDTYPGRDFTGNIAAIDSFVDTATRNVKVRASFANPDKLLLPGMFATVKIDIGEPQRFVTLPKTTISYNSYGDIVFLVEEKKGADGKDAHLAKQIFVTTGLTRGGQVAILSGVKEGDVVVSSGQVKLRNGVPLNIDNSVQPSANPNPAVADE